MANCVCDRTLLSSEHEAVWCVFSDIREGHFAWSIEQLAQGVGLGGEVAGCYYWSSVSKNASQNEHLGVIKGCRFEGDEMPTVILSYEELYYYMDLDVKWHIQNYSDKPEYVERLNNALAAYRERFLNSESPEAILARVPFPDESEKQKIIYLFGKKDAKGIFIMGRPSLARVGERFKAQPSLEEKAFGYYPELREKFYKLLKESPNLCAAELFADET